MYVLILGFYHMDIAHFFLCLLDFGDSVLKNGTGDGFEYWIREKFKLISFSQY